MNKGTFARWRNVNEFQDAEEIIHDGHIVTLSEDIHPLDKDVPDEDNLNGAMVWCTECGTEFLAFSEELD